MHRVIAVVAALLPLSLVLSAMGGQERPLLDELRVVEDREVDFSPNHAIGLSPDGRWLAVWHRGDDANAICIYDAATLTESGCVPIETERLDLSTAVWSPDSTRLAVTEDATTFVIDSDLWVVDVGAGMVTNLTDDGIAGPMATDRDRGQVDLAPAWSPDGSALAFVRSSGKETALYRIPVDGGEARQIAIVDPERAFLVSDGTAWLPNDTLLSSVAAPAAHPGDGIWAVPVGGGEPRRLIGPDPDLGPPLLIAVSATGFGLLSYPQRPVVAEGQPGPEVALARLATGEVDLIEASDAFRDGALKPWATAAAFPPDGERLLISYSTGGGGLLVARDLTTGEERMVQERGL
ncbi:MAG: PD40 domain-containing protein [Chloroflexia bacterium]|nr:PD40 domain-containing protein [Chloroflexia bacterium]